MDPFDENAEYAEEANEEHFLSIMPLGYDAVAKIAYINFMDMTAVSSVASASGRLVCSCYIALPSFTALAA